jgi:hypothetical protein
MLNAQPKTKGRSEERQQELAKIEETMRIKAEERRKKAEERRERLLAKQSSAPGADDSAKAATAPSGSCVSASRPISLCASRKAMVIPCVCVCV